MTDNDPNDGAQWDAVEEATEMMLEGAHHDALLKLRDVLRADPRNPYAYYYTATAMYELGQFDACAEAYRAALRLQPRYLAARVGLSHALRILDEPRAAIGEARQALQQSPTDADALYALGLAQAAVGDRRQAIATLEAFLDAGPEFEVAAEGRAMLEKLKADEPDNDAN